MTWRGLLAPVRRLHPLHHLRSVPGGERVLSRLDREVTVAPAGIEGPVRIRSVRHAAYRLLAAGPEPEFRAAFEAECARRGARTLYDVGANFGYYSLVFVSGGRDRRAVAVEPQADNLTLLRWNAAGRDGIHVEDAVASAAAGALTFAPDAATGHTGHVTSDDAHGVRVRAVTLDGLAARYGPPDVVKIDVEGHELDVLRGAATVLAGRDGAGPSVFVECFHGLGGPCVALLRDNGYALDDAERPGPATERTTNFLATRRA
jgi:FkbM family methyltransferase